MAGEAVAVLAPSVFVSITIESAPTGDDVHIHAGGQGIWVGRMLHHLGYRPQACAPIGGESGQALYGLSQAWGIELHPIEVVAVSPAYIHDRRDGERVEVARSREPDLRRHESDQLHNRFLALALAAGTAVVTGPVNADLLPADFYRRLGADLASAGIPVAADLHGAHLDGFLDGGPIDVVKVSAGDLVEDGVLDADAAEPGAPVEPVAAAADALVERGAKAVVVSRGGDPPLARFGERYLTVTGPELEVVDPTGSGDSMTAALTAGLVEGADPATSLRRAWAAGAANVTRHGLGSGIPALIDELMDRAVASDWSRDGTDEKDT